MVDIISIDDYICHIMEDKSSSNKNIIKKEEQSLSLGIEKAAKKPAISRYEKLSSALKENIKRRKNALTQKKGEN